ncbi:hypothetical protein [Candidatus Amarolinea dominans]|uniref:hypothetical protein n=1 Tax=Candidatus Amarolinea dominans TaxID=3140696 RepID=UPI001D2BD36A|nr:hypothetical protein [Anaerolineae bacterium]
MWRQRTTGEFQRYVESGGTSTNRRFAFVLARSFTVNQGWSDAQAEVDRLAQFTDERRGDRSAIVRWPILSGR